MSLLLTSLTAGLLGGVFEEIGWTGFACWKPSARVRAPLRSATQELADARQRTRRVLIRCLGEDRFQRDAVEFFELLEKLAERFGAIQG